MVGAGDEEARLKLMCHELGLPVYDKAAIRGQAIGSGGPETGIANRNSQVANGQPGVHFYGFRQIDQNPVFYSLADAFILPSLWEEWGLVVNEAMASGLPVVVSENAGCAEDLLEAGAPETASYAGHLSLVRDLGLTTRLRRNGFVFDPNSSDELSRALLLLESCTELRTSMGQVSRRIVEKFSCENFARNAMRAIEAAQVKN